MIKNLILCIGTVMILQSCNDDQTIEINDFQQTQEFILNSSDKSFFTYGNDVVVAMMHVKGNIEGEVSITGTSPVGGVFSGKIDTFMRNDYFSDTATILVIPRGEVSGHLKIVFTFGKI